MSDTQEKDRSQSGGMLAGLMHGMLGRDTTPQQPQEGQSGGRADEEAEKEGHQKQGERTGDAHGQKHGEANAQSGEQQRAGRDDAEDDEEEQEERKRQGQQQREREEQKERERQESKQRQRQEDDQEQKRRQQQPEQSRHQQGQHAKKEQRHEQPQLKTRYAEGTANGGAQQQNYYDSELAHKYHTQADGHSIAHGHDEHDLHHRQHHSALPVARPALFIRRESEDGRELHAFDHPSLANSHTLQKAAVVAAPAGVGHPVRQPEAPLPVARPTQYQSQPLKQTPLGPSAIAAQRHYDAQLPHHPPQAAPQYQSFYAQHAPRQQQQAYSPQSLQQQQYSSSPPYMQQDRSRSFGGFPPQGASSMPSQQQMYKGGVIQQQRFDAPSSPPPPSPTSTLVHHTQQQQAPTHGVPVPVATTTAPGLSVIGPSSVDAALAPVAGTLSAHSYPGFKSGVQSLIAERTMAAVTTQGKGAAALREVDVPHVQHEDDIVIRVTGTSICSTDKRIYNGDIFDLRLDDILGHEAVGQVVQLGSNVTDFRLGERVVASYALSCGMCDACLTARGRTCDAARDDCVDCLGKRFGRRLNGLEGMAHFASGGMAGCQAQYVRIPCAQYNALKIPDTVTDEMALMLSDQAVSAWHTVADTDMEVGESVLIIGAGPVGQLVAQVAQLFGAGRIVLVDALQSRLDWAQWTLGPDIEVVNPEDPQHCPRGFREAMLALEPHGFDVCFDCAGPPKAPIAASPVATAAVSLPHKVAEKVVPRRLSQSGPLKKAIKSISPATGIAHPLNECIGCARHAGRVSIVSDYMNQLGNFSLGLLTEKAVRLYGHGQPPIQRYWQELLDEYILTGKYDPTKVLTHRYSLEQVPRIYDLMYAKKFSEEPGARPILKTFIQTKFSTRPAPGMPTLSRLAEEDNGGRAKGNAQLNGGQPYR